LVRIPTLLAAVVLQWLIEVLLGCSNVLHLTPSPSAHF
jgi:hypothetical protein